MPPSHPYLAPPPYNLQEGGPKRLHGQTIPTGDEEGSSSRPCLSTAMVVLEVVVVLVHVYFYVLHVIRNKDCNPWCEVL